MFEFISKILVTLTPAQRLWALTIVLVSIVIITLGPGWINRNDCSDLYPIVKNQKQEIASLNQEILEVQKECTSSRIKRENEIRELVDQLEIEIAQLGAGQSQIRKLSYTRIDTIKIDTVSIPRRTIERIESPAPMDLSKVRKSIKCIKEKIGDNHLPPSPGN
jgi:hypothetical protein